MEIESEPTRSSVSESPTISEQEDKTMIMPAGTGEVQGQLEIAFSQIKNAQQKVSL